MVPFAAEPIVRVGFFTTTSSFLYTIIVDGGLLGLIFTLRRKILLIPNDVL